MKQTIYLDPGSKKSTTFEVKLLDSGVYRVEIEGLDVTFSAEQPPPVCINSPTGGEEWIRGQEYVIQWTTHDVDEIEVTYRWWKSLPPNADTLSRPITGTWNPIPPIPNTYLWTVPADTEPGTYTIVVAGFKNGKLVARVESDYFTIIGINKYTTGIYYLYANEYEGSEDWYNWKPDWEDWCKQVVGYHRDLFVAYLQEQGITNASMPIEFVEKQGLPERSNARDWINSEIENAPRYNNVDIRIVTQEDAIMGGAAAWPWKQSILVRAYSMWRSREGMEGNTQMPIDQTFSHEIAHLFGLDHCGEFPCPMSQVQFYYNDWVNLGKKQWFCDRHRAELLYRWQTGMLGYWPHAYLALDVVQ